MHSMKAFFAARMQISLSPRSFSVCHVPRFLSWITSTRIPRTRKEADEGGKAMIDGDATGRMET
jgi:hypothetical protein